MDGGGAGVVGASQWRHDSLSLDAGDGATTIYVCILGVFFP